MENKLLCLCGCGNKIIGRKQKKFFNTTCRTRYLKRRRVELGQPVVGQEKTVELGDLFAEIPYQDATETVPADKDVQSAIPETVPSLGAFMAETVPAPHRRWSPFIMSVLVDHPDINPDIVNFQIVNKLIIDYWKNKPLANEMEI